MSYDVTKLTNLGQMKSALQRVASEVASAKSVRSTATISVSNWAAYDQIFRYPSIISVTNYHYYDIHLASDTSQTISLMCANADIRAKVENGGIYLYCYGTKPTDNFTLEIITTPTTTNDIGLTYDIGDDFLVYPSITDALAARITALETAMTTDVPAMLLYTQNASLPEHRWVASGDSTYPYQAVLNMTDVTSSYYPEVQFRDSDSLLYDFSPNAVTGAGTVTIYCKTKPSTTVILPSVVCFKCKTVTSS